MIFYTIHNFWNRYGWYFIFFGSLCILLGLWIYNKKSSGTCTISASSILQKIAEPVFYAQHPSNLPTSPKRQEDKCSKGEKKCKEFLEYYFQKQFEKVRPDFLINPVTHQPLELDCYNEELRLAVEYNGKQHYVYNKMMHQNSKDSFRNQQYRDHIKKDLCEKHGIRLIIVPYSVQEDKIPEFLYDSLKKYGYVKNGLL